MMFNVRSQHKPRQLLVLDSVNRVTDNAQDVKTRQDRLGQVDIVAESDGRVVAPADWI